MKTPVLLIISMAAALINFEPFYRKSLFTNRKPLRFRLNADFKNLNVKQLSNYVSQVQMMG